MFFPETASCFFKIFFYFREYELIESESQWKEVLRQTNAGSGVQVRFSLLFYYLRFLRYYCLDSLFLLSRLQAFDVRKWNQRLELIGRLTDTEGIGNIGK